MSRNFYDGSGSDKRLRVKGIVDLPPPVRPERSPDLPDPGKVEEIHREARTALAEDDDHKVGKIFEDVLDDIHRSKSRSHERTATWLDDVRELCSELEAALNGELKILGEADRAWGWAYKLDETGLTVLARDPNREGWTCTADKRAILKALADCRFDARHTAGVLISRSRREILSTRSSHLDQGLS